METILTEDVVTEVAGTRLSGFLAHPAQPEPGVLVLHAWWGLNEFFKDLSRRLAQEGFLVFAPDLMGGKVAKTIAEAEKLVQERNFVEAHAAALAAVQYLQDLVDAQPGAAHQAIGVVGFSMGAAWALNLAEEVPDAVRAAVLFYGAGDANYDKVRASVQGHFAGKDDYEEPQYIQSMEEGLLGAGLPVHFYQYPDAVHWFMESDRPGAYNPADAHLAWQRAVAFLNQILK